MTNSIIMLAGLPGTGKSTIAERLEERLDYDVHSLLGVKRDFGHKRYSPKQNPAVFQELYRRTKKSLDQGRGVILDNAYITQDGRKPVYEIAQHYGVDVLIIECYCSEKESKRRMQQRPKKDGLVVESKNPKAYDKLAVRWEDIAKDLNTFSGIALSYVRYNTEDNSFDEVKVTEKVQPLINIIKPALSNNSQSPSPK